MVTDPLLSCCPFVYVQIGMTFKVDQKAVIAALDKLADDEAALDVST
jgi:hypothetical protein